MVIYIIKSLVANVDLSVAEGHLMHCYHLKLLDLRLKLPYPKTLLFAAVLMLPEVHLALSKEHH